MQTLAAVGAAESPHAGIDGAIMVGVLLFLDHLREEGCDILIDMVY
ncbi:hypothetical protein Q6D67_01215 [Haliea sp. E1-2-M8]|nr:hypothetical protein [Haliea sp. E1-2-M8]MDO8860303.1 hypothetical protein [Haliea sp. E1-2-M8]